MAQDRQSAAPPSTPSFTTLSLNDQHAISRSVQWTLAIIQDYVPRACRRELEDKLIDSFEAHGLELTNFAMRKEWEQWKKLQLDVMALTPAGSVPRGSDGRSK